MSLSVDIEKRLGSFQLRVKLEAQDGVTALLGASGCGKSMTLKCIAGIETPDRGRIVLNGVTLFDSERHIDLPPQKRRVGYLFQQYALFPNMTVAQNIRCGCRNRESKAAEAAVGEMLRAMALEGLENLRPAQLSGGQQQRTALARILVGDPEALLLDEPFSALDAHLRFQTENEVRALAARFSKPVLLVSHDRDEVFRLSQDIAVMNAGQVEVFGERHQVFSDPVTRSGARLTGCKNVSPIRRLDAKTICAEDWGIRLTLDGPVGEDIRYAGLRMHGIVPGGQGPNALRCRVMDVMENPFTNIVVLHPVDGPEGTGFAWELDKAAWAALRAPELEISLPSESILLLKE